MMDFKSQIATTRELSEQLLALGLKPETADMVYHYTKSRVKSMEWELQAKTPTLRGQFWTPERISKLKSPFHKHPDGSLMTGEEIFDSLWGKDVPAWTLARLLELMPGIIYENGMKDYQLNIYGNFLSYSYFVNERHMGDLVFINHNGNILRGVISIISWLISKEYFNKDYLK